MIPANSCRAFDMSGRALSGFRALSNTVNLVPIKLDLKTQKGSRKPPPPKFLHEAPRVFWVNKQLMYEIFCNLSFPTKFSPPLDRSVASTEMR